MGEGDWKVLKKVCPVRTFGYHSFFLDISMWVSLLSHTEHWPQYLPPHLLLLIPILLSKSSRLKTLESLWTLPSPSFLISNYLVLLVNSCPKHFSNVFTGHSRSGLYQLIPETMTIPQSLSKSLSISKVNITLRPLYPRVILLLASFQRLLISFVQSKLLCLVVRPFTNLSKHPT